MRLTAAHQRATRSVRRVGSDSVTRSLPAPAGAALSSATSGTRDWLKTHLALLWPY